MELLDDRLTAVARYVLPGSIVADIGTDHGYLPVYLVAAGVCPQAVAGEVNWQPYESALKTVQEHGLTDWISVRQGDGLAVVKPGEVDTVVVAGLGGTTIQQILAGSPDVLTQVRRLILQPMVGAGNLRRWLLTNGWQIVDEELVAEAEFLYIIIVAEPGRQSLENALLLDIGPVIWEKRDPLLGEYLKRRIAQLERVKVELARGRSFAAVSKMAKITRQIEEMRRMQSDVS